MPVDRPRRTRSNVYQVNGNQHAAAALLHHRRRLASLSQDSLLPLFESGSRITDRGNRPGRRAGRAALPNGLLLHVWDAGYGVCLFSRTFLVARTVCSLYWRGVSLWLCSGGCRSCLMYMHGWFSVLRGMTGFEAWLFHPAWLCTSATAKFRLFLCNGHNMSYSSDSRRGCKPN